MGDEYEPRLIDSLTVLPHFPEQGLIVIGPDAFAGWRKSCPNISPG